MKPEKVTSNENTTVSDDPTNSDSNSKKFKLSKILFILAIPVLAFASIKTVGLVAPTFSSLASLSDSLDKKINKNNDNDKKSEEIKIAKEYAVINSNDEIKISWETVEKSDNNYAFKYDCSEGMLVTIVKQDGVKEDIPCNEDYVLNNKNEITLKVNSIAYHYSDLNYSISVLDGNKSVTKEARDSLTIINKNLAKDSATSSLALNDVGATTTVNTDNNETVIEVTDSTGTSTTTNENLDKNKEENNKIETNDKKDSDIETQISATSTEKVIDHSQNKENNKTKTEITLNDKTKSNTGKTTKQEVTNYYNIKKEIDLAITFINSGTILDKVFFPGQIKQKEKGAIQFEVRNIGNKVSKTWKYRVLLPSGKEYVSKVQQPLKPNERTLVSLGFYTYSNNNHTFIIKVETTNDNDLFNNQVIKPVTLYK